MTDAPRHGSAPDPPSQPGTSAELLPQVYDELRRLARVRLAREPAGLTLQPTALVHEAYLRLTKHATDQRWERRGHFFGAAAIAMRRILVERARHYRRVRHGGEQQRVELDNEAPAPSAELADVLAIDQALTRRLAILHLASIHATVDQQRAVRSYAIPRDRKQSRLHVGWKR